MKTENILEIRKGTLIVRPDVLKERLSHWLLSFVCMVADFFKEMNLIFSHRSTFVYWSYSDIFWPRMIVVFFDILIPAPLISPNAVRNKRWIDLPYG